MASETKGKQHKAMVPKTKTKSGGAVASNDIPPKRSRSTKQPTTDESVDSIKPGKGSRKRAADFFNGEESEPSAKTDKSKDKQSGKKTKGTSETKPSKEDGHPVETAKAFPGGDMVEVEPAKAPKDKKRKLKGSEDFPADVETDLTVEESGEKKPIPKRGRKKKPDEVAPIDAPDEPASAEASKPEKALKALKGKKGKAAVISNSAQVVAEDAALLSQNGDKVRKGKTQEKASISVSAVPDGEKESLDNIDDFLPAETKAKTKSRARNDVLSPAPDNGIEIIPNVMDEGPFQTLLENESNGAATEAVAPPKPGPATSGTAQPLKPSNAASKKKRKMGSDTSNLVDRLAETGSAQKRPRKSEESHAGMSKAVKDFASSSIEAATKSAASASEYVGSLIGNGQKSIAEDVAAVAEGAVEEKKLAKKARSSKKGKEKTVDDDATALKRSEPTEESLKLPPNDEDDEEAEQNSEAEEEVDDQTADLLKGFESSDEEADSGDEGYKQGTKMPKLPAKTTKELKKVKAGEEPGVVYVGRIPHGFYEQEMRTYFTQFGDVTKLRLSRNKKTGRSKHFAFIEFASNDVASIVAQTMDNYLMFGHILKCHLVPKGQLHKNLWKGANKKFRVVPWAKIEARKLEQPASKEVWGKRIEKEEARREKKLEKVKNIGYEFDVGTLKRVEDVGIEAVEETTVQEVMEKFPEKQEKASKKRKTQKDKAIEDAPNEAVGSSDGIESGEVGSSEIVEQTIVVESAKTNDGQLRVFSEEVTKKSRKSGKKGKGVETAAANTVTGAPDMNIPAARIAADEIVENLSNAAHSIGQAIGLTSNAERAAATDVANEEGTAKDERKRKAKDDVEAKPAKKGKKESGVVDEVKPVKEKKQKAVKEKKDKSGKDVAEKPVREKVPKEKEKIVKEKKEKAPKKDKKATI